MVSKIDKDRSNIVYLPRRGYCWDFAIAKFLNVLPAYFERASQKCKPPKKTVSSVCSAHRTRRCQRQSDTSWWIVKCRMLMGLCKLCSTSPYFSKFLRCFNFFLEEFQNLPFSTQARFNWCITGGCIQLCCVHWQNIFDVGQLGTTT